MYVKLQRPIPQGGAWDSIKGAVKGTFTWITDTSGPKQSTESRITDIQKKQAEEAQLVAQQQAILQQERAQKVQLIVAGGAVLGVVGLALLLKRRRS